MVTRVTRSVIYKNKSVINRNSLKRIRGNQNGYPLIQLALYTPMWYNNSNKLVPDINTRS